MYNNATVTDLQCRFSEGEIVTWEEFYKWIDDILDGFDTHDHSGVSGSGPTLNIANLTGYAALEARVAALEAAGSTYATQTWVGDNFYTKTEVNSIESGLQSDIDLIETDIFTMNQDIVNHEGRLDAIELDYATEAWVALNYYNKTEISGFYMTLSDAIDLNLADIMTNKDDIDACESRLNAIEGDYYDKAAIDGMYTTLNGYIDVNHDAIVVNTSDISWNSIDIGYNAGNISDNAGDISSLDGRVSDIEADYTTYAQAEDIAYDAVVDLLSGHEAACANWTG